MGIAGNGAVQTQFAALAPNRLAFIVEDLHGESESASLQLAAIDRQRRRAERKARHDIRSAGDR